MQAQCEAKNHALVLEDCDLESTVNAIINSTYGCAGMRCMALPVIVVQESIADKFVALLREKAMAMKVGCAYDPETKLGPVVSANTSDFPVASARSVMGKLPKPLNRPMLVS